MNKNYLYLWSLPIFDCRTLFDLTFKEAMWRYLKRILLVTLFISVSLLFVYTRINTLSPNIIIVYGIIIISVSYPLFYIVKMLSSHNKPVVISPRIYMKQTGDVCQISGIYRVVNHIKHPQDITIAKGQTFPPCAQCKEKVGYRLVRREAPNVKKKANTKW